MSFLAPWSALAAAALAVPLLLLLYFLKLRRRRLTMASTLLWRRSFEDLQVNVPFQRLRLSTLFALQMLLLLLLLVALAQPVLWGAGAVSPRAILLIDQSASMSARDDPAGAGPTRLERAKVAAKQIVDRLASTGGGTRVLVIAMGARSRLLSDFETRRDVLHDAIDSIEPSDEEANLEAALALAGTFTVRRDEVAEAPPEVLLLSDGGVAPPRDAAGFSLRGGTLRFVQVAPEAAGSGGGGPGETAGADADAAGRSVGAAGSVGNVGKLSGMGNVGIVSLNARRDLETPERALVFVRLINAGPQPVDAALTLSVDGVDGPVTPASLPAAGDQPGETTVSFAVELPGGAVLSVRHAGRDALASDDTAAVVLPAPAQPRIALVHGDSGPDPYLEALLAEWQPRELREMTIAAFDAEQAAPDEGRAPPDVVVFDRVAPSRLPDVPTITFGAVPPGVSERPAASPGGKRVLSWQRQHAIMRHVALDAVRYAGFGGLELPRGGIALATGPDGPVIGLFRAQGAEHVVVGFALSRSNWATNVSITVFLQNVLDHLMLVRSGQSSIVFRPAETIAVRAAPGAETLEVRGPDVTADVPVAPGGEGGAVTLPALSRVGLYTVRGAAPPYERVAVSLLSDVESDIRPRTTLYVNAESVAAGAAERATPRGIWPWFVLVAFAVLVVEWIVYCKAVRA